MVDPKRIEKKLPLLLATGPTIGFDYEEKDWWTRRLKRDKPQEYINHVNRIISDVAALERDVLLHKKQNRQRY